MRNSFVTPAGLVALMLLGLILAGRAEARRLALVVGNDNYQNVQHLTNARSDAKAIAAELGAVGFDVALKLDLSEKFMKAALRDFKSQVHGGDDVVFYFSGHGVQFGGTNYLIPVDIAADSEAQVADDAVSLQRILDDMTEQKVRFSLAIIDACRSNPFKEAGRAIGGRGLVPVTPATGQMIMFSAGAGQAALDSLSPKDKNPNGVFTRVLIQHMRMPGIAAGNLLKDVQGDVVDLAHGVGHEQVPALYDQSLGKFYFRPGAPGETPAGSPPAVAATPAIHVPSQAELDESYWQGIKGSKDAADFTSYAKSFPKGMHLAEAEMLGRKVSRDSAKPAPTPSNERPVPGGPYPGWGTSSLLPGVVGNGTVMVNNDGSIDTSTGNGDHGHTILNVSDPDNVTGTATNHLGKIGGSQIRYPDGSTSTQVTIRGKLVHGVLTGTYFDKFQTGTFGWTVAPPK